MWGIKIKNNSILIAIVILFILLIGVIISFNVVSSEENFKTLQNEINVPFEHIIISATHTHSAPNLSGVVGWGDIDKEYYNNIFLPAVIKASKNAIENLQSAELSVGVTQSLVGINRRQQHKNGEIGLGQNPHGCFDPNMTVISIRNSETKEGILNLEDELSLSSLSSTFL